MNHFCKVLVLNFLILNTVSAQTIFDVEIDVPENYAPKEVIMPPSPLNTQILFIGGIDSVATNATYGNEAGFATAKEWHDFIGFTSDESGESLGWVSVNHERIIKDERLGDGGGMTVFKITATENDSIKIIEQTLEDGRTGHFFNVDFVNTVGETGMNCGGINTSDGRVWTAEEWFRVCNTGCGSSGIAVLDSDGNIINGLADTMDFTIKDSGIEFADGTTLAKYQNFNWMVEIDPKQATAIRKQYNWGRQPFEGGVIMPDNKTVYFGPDATPAFFSKFVANEAGDFTKGNLYLYKADADEKWIAVNNDMDAMININNLAAEANATMYNRLEWVTYSEQTGKVYFAETGRDNPGSRWADEAESGATHAAHHIARAAAQNLETPSDSNYYDYYGRVLQFDPETDEFSVLIEGGPYINEADSVTPPDYPTKHLSNPDGLSTATIDGQDFLIIQEDLNGSSYGRVPAGITNRMCEVYLLNLAIANPTIDDLIRLMVVPAGAEVTGARFLPDGNTLLINSQHPKTDNPYPYNHSITMAVTGFKNVKLTSLEDFQIDQYANALQIFPNPTTRVVQFNKIADIALFDSTGKRVKVLRNTNEIDVSHLEKGVYYIQTSTLEIRKLLIQ